MVSRKASLFLFGIAVAACPRVQAQARPEAPEYDVKEHYTKYEYRIAMRDSCGCSRRCMFQRIYCLWRLALRRNLSVTPE